ncbi:hypothetical protein [Nannocystis radixulma]|uniref:HEAT repeat-containing protein n=1 Tax=Nannocystis radixulma TaxID=2995305 RepID=A0ABT5B051_9BACT|nr:hypothetical protein [Nannocystis radixulma]MDC0666456.1 hypothetical protein [Nannocystis radixulma]
MTSDDHDRQPIALLRRALARAARQTVARQLPIELPGLLVEEGIWSPAEALERIDSDSARHLAALAPRLPRELALAALARADTSGDSFHDVAGLVALADRALELGATGEVFEVLTGLPAEARGLVVARVGERLPPDLRASAVRLVLADFPLSGDPDACVARLLFARLVPEQRDALVREALHALGEFPVEPYQLRWMARIGAVAPAVEQAREHDEPRLRAPALAAVIPWCDGRLRAKSRATWREDVTALLAAGRRPDLPLPLPARPDELAELVTLARGLPQPRARAVALAHLAVHHREYVDEALAAVRLLDDLDRVLGLASLLPALAVTSRHDVAGEAWTLLTRLDVDRPSISDLFKDWPGSIDEPPVESYAVSPTPADLRTRVAVHLAPVQRREAALALLAAARRIDDTHYRAAALATFGAHLPDPEARARVFARAEALALASTRPWLGLVHLLARVDPEVRPTLACRALAALPDELDQETLHNLPPLLAALTPDDAAALVTRILLAGSWSIVNDLQANVAAALRAGAVRPLAELLLGEDAPHGGEYVLPQLLRHADAELHPRIAAAVLEPFEDEDLWQFPEILPAVPWLSPDERAWLVARIPRKPLGGKFGNRREPLILALARPLAEQGAFDLLRPLLPGAGRAHRLAALADALPFLDPSERERVTKQLFGDLRRDNCGLTWDVVPALAAAGYADALVDLPTPLDARNLARIAPHVSADRRPRLLELLVHAAGERPTSTSLHVLGSLRHELPRDVLARLCEVTLADAAESGRAELLRALVAEARDDDDEHDAVDPGLTSALVELAGPTGLPALVALLDDLDDGPSS